MRRTEIRTSYEQQNCDVCGRTMLRGERAETYLDGGSRRLVCELCQPRALHEGWVRDGGADLDRSRAAAEQRQSFLARLRTRRERGRDGEELEDDLPPGGGEDLDPLFEGPTAPPLPEPPPFDPAAPVRHVRAVPASIAQKVAVALERFNDSEHPRTVAGIARSLGAPVVTARATAGHASEVDVVVAWELCWYRYRVDLGAADDAVRLAGQGYELAELEPEDQDGNAVADEHGFLHPEAGTTG